MNIHLYQRASQDQQSKCKLNNLSSRMNFMIFGIYIYISIYLYIFLLFLKVSITEITNSKLQLDSFLRIACTRRGKASKCTGIKRRHLCGWFSLKNNHRSLSCLTRRICNLTKRSLGHRFVGHHMAKLIN